MLRKSEWPCAVVRCRSMSARHKRLLVVVLLAAVTGTLAGAGRRRPGPVGSIWKVPDVRTQRALVAQLNAVAGTVTANALAWERCRPKLSAHPMRLAACRLGLPARPLPDERAGASVDRSGATVPGTHYAAAAARAAATGMPAAAREWGTGQPPAGPAALSRPRASAACSPTLPAPPGRFGTSTASRAFCTGPDRHHTAARGHSRRERHRQAPPPPGGDAGHRRARDTGRPSYRSLATRPWAPIGRSRRFRRSRQSRPRQPAMGARTARALRARGDGPPRSPRARLVGPGSLFAQGFDDCDRGRASRLTFAGVSRSVGGRCPSGGLVGRCGSSFGNQLRRLIAIQVGPGRLRGAWSAERGGVARPVAGASLTLSRPTATARLSGRCRRISSGTWARSRC